MEKAQWKQVKEIFSHLCEESPSFRANYLDMVCVRDSAVRRQVEAMLQSHDDLQTVEAFPQINQTINIPNAIGDYQLTGELGRGGMGVVYRADHARHGRVALKVLPLRLLQNQRANQRFALEAKLLGKLDHPIVCRIYEASVVDDYAFIAMEEIIGNTLSTKIDEKPLGLPEALDITLKLADGLTQAHDAGVTHRDIKPSNVIISHYGEPHLIDFGIAKFADTRLTATGEIMGSPAYMSPEQWRGDTVDGRTDVWSLGVLLFEMVSGYTPFTGDSVGAIAQSVLSADIPPLPRHGNNDSQLAAVEKIISGMLTVNRNIRFDTMAVVADRLRQLPK